MTTCTSSKFVAFVDLLRSIFRPILLLTCFLKALCALSFGAVLAARLWCSKCTEYIYFYFLQEKGSTIFLSLFFHSSLFPCKETLGINLTWILDILGHFISNLREYIEMSHIALFNFFTFFIYHHPLLLLFIIF